MATAALLGLALSTTFPSVPGVDAAASDAVAAAELDTASVADPRIYHLLVARVPNITPDRAARLAITIEEAAERYGFEPTFVLGVIRVESYFDPRAVSKVGAIGLMQVLPATGQQVAAELGIPWRGRRTLFDAEDNVRIGTHYLAWLVKRFGGNRTLALASYCHGPGTIRRFVRAGHVPPYRLRYARKVRRAEQRVIAALARVPVA